MLGRNCSYDSAPNREFSPRNVLAVLATLLALIGCSRKEPQEHSVGWLKITVDTAYKGHPLHFVAYSECIRKYVAGGRFGSAPGGGTISMRPKTIGQPMPDGSFVAIRVPELCPGYFASGTGAGNWTLEATSFFPLMVWSDRRWRPTINEAYASDEAYRTPLAKLAWPIAVAFPLTSIPADLEAAARKQPRDVILDDVVNLDASRNEIGDKPREVALRAMVGWPTIRTSETDSYDYRFDYNCLKEFQRGQLVPRRKIHRYSFEECKRSLASITPFVWDGRQFVADSQRSGILVFQRIAGAMRRAPYFADGRHVEFPPAAGIGDQNTYFVVEIPAPVRDPNLGK